MNRKPSASRLCLAVLICAQVSILALAQEPAQVVSPLTAKIAAALQDKEPDWDYHTGVCTCGPVVPGQVAMDIGAWDRKDEEGNLIERVDVDVYTIASADEASDWMSGHSSGKLYAHCQVQKYSLGDEAYMVGCAFEPRNTAQTNVGIDFRKNKYIVEVRGGSWDTVERFAKYAFVELPSEK